MRHIYCSDEYENALVSLWKHSPIPREACERAVKMFKERGPGSSGEIARELGVDRSSLLYWISRHGLKR